MTDDTYRSGSESSDQLALVGNDGGFGLPEASTYERDDGSVGEIPPDEVFMPPIRTRSNGWKKWHAKPECGRETVYFIESQRPMHGTPRYDWKLYCASCGHQIRWDEILYLSQEWYVDRRHAGERWDWRSFGDLHLTEEEVLELGTDPTESELVAAIGTAWDRYRQRVDEYKEWSDENLGPSGTGSDHDAPPD